MVFLLGRHATSEESSFVGIPAVSFESRTALRTTSTLDAVIVLPKDHLEVRGDAKKKCSLPGGASSLQLPVNPFLMHFARA